MATDRGRRVEARSGHTSTQLRAVVVARCCHRPAQSIRSSPRSMTRRAVHTPPPTTWTVESRREASGDSRPPIKHPHGQRRVSATADRNLATGKRNMGADMRPLARSAHMHCPPTCRQRKRGREPPSPPQRTASSAPAAAPRDCAHRASTEEQIFALAAVAAAARHTHTLGGARARAMHDDCRRHKLIVFCNSLLLMKFTVYLIN